MSVFKKERPFSALHSTRCGYVHHFDRGLFINLHVCSHTVHCCLFVFLFTMHSYLTIGLHTNEAAWNLFVEVSSMPRVLLQGHCCHFLIGIYLCERTSKDTRRHQTH